jgi:hypothetical protein
MELSPGFTGWGRTVEVLEAKFASPLYTVYIRWFPTIKFEMVKVARPLLGKGTTAKVLLVRVSKKVTVPVGVPAPGAFTVTGEVKVTGSPKTVGPGNKMSVVVVAWLTVCVRLPLLAVKLPSPP